MKPIVTRILLGSLAVVVGCGDQPCVVPPCPPPVGANIRISGSSGGSVTAFVKDTRTGEIISTCSGVTAFCVVGGSIGRFDIEIGAQGFRSVTRSLDITGTEPEKCGCLRLDTQNIDITLTPLS